MEDSISIHESRRRAPLHFWVRAENAHFAAYSLWLASSQAQDAAAERIDYHGSTQIALLESFRREAALALELAIKAVIAQRIENGTSLPCVTRVRPVHDLPELWREAQLPILPKADRGRLIHAKHILLWTGRYPAPNKDEQYETMTAEEQPYEEVFGTLGRFTLRTRPSFTWDDFDRIFQATRTAIWELIPCIDDDGFLIRR